MYIGMGNGPVEVVISSDKLNAYVFVPEEVRALDPEAVKAALQEAGVICGINDEALISFAAAPQAQPVLVAEGLPPQRGEDERVEWFFAAENQTRDDKNDQLPDQIDFRDTSTVVSVEAGTLLARKHPAVPGVPGTAVTGEPLPPPEPRRVELKAGKNVELQSGGTKAFSQVDGRPWFKQAGNTYIINVDPLLVQKGDVSIKTGHIRFKGDVRVLGNVGEAMQVEASGNVEITGLVTRATIISGGRLVVRRGVINSRLKAGSTFSGARKLSFMLRDIKAGLEQIGLALEQLQRNKDFQQVNFGRLIMTLLDTRFKNLRPLVKNSLRQIASARGDIPEEVTRCGKSLQCLIGLNPLTVKSFSAVTRDVNEASRVLEDEAVTPADIIIHSAMSASLQCSGNVMVIGQGCVNTTINADGHVNIKGSFKGGEIFCEGNAEIQELGSSLGVPPLVRVGATGQIRVRRAFAGAILQVGQRKHVLAQDMGSFKVRLAKSGELELIAGL